MEERVVKVPETGIGDLSDGYHTFNQLYYQRMMLFAVIVNWNKHLAWKSRRHDDGGLCFGGGWFIVGITTPEGDYTYHYEDKYFDLFECEELEKGRAWDGHNENDVTRLFSLPERSDITAFPVERERGIRAIAKSVREMCEKEGIDFLFITEGHSEWSINGDGHIRDVMEYHKGTEPRESIEKSDKSESGTYWINAVTDTGESLYTHESVPSIETCLKQLSIWENYYKYWIVNAWIQDGDEKIPVEKEWVVRREV